MYPLYISTFSLFIFVFVVHFCLRIHTTHPAVAKRPIRNPVSVETSSAIIIFGFLVDHATDSNILLLIVHCTTLVFSQYFRSWLLICVLFFFLQVEKKKKTYSPQNNTSLYTTFCVKYISTYRSVTNIFSRVISCGLR